MKTPSYKGIPAKHRPAVARMITAMRFTSGKLPSPQDVYQQLKAGWEKRAGEQAAKNAADLKAILEDQRGRAVSQVRQAIEGLAAVRDAIERIADGSPEQVGRYGGMDVHDFAAMVHAYMEKKGGELEGGLYLLDIAEPHNPRQPHNGGWFLESFPTKILNK